MDGLFLRPAYERCFSRCFFLGKLEAGMQHTSPKISPYMAVYEKIMKICWKESIQN